MAYWQLKQRMIVECQCLFYFRLITCQNILTTPNCNENLESPWYCYQVGLHPISSISSPLLSRSWNVWRKTEWIFIWLLSIRSSKVTSFLRWSTTSMSYRSMIEPLITYCSICYYPALSVKNRNRLLKISHVSAKIIGLPTQLLSEIIDHAILKKALLSLLSLITRSLRSSM